jgi:excisionase family DNA binding protein
MCKGRTTICVAEICERLGIGEHQVYQMLKDNIIPNIRYGRRYIVSRAAFERWEQSIGVDSTPHARVA